MGNDIKRYHGDFSSFWSLGHWNFGFVCDLVLGIWNFILRAGPRRRPYDFVLFLHLFSIPHAMDCP
jgi:hypothetical protein